LDEEEDAIVTHYHSTSKSIFVKYIEILRNERWVARDVLEKICLDFVEYRCSHTIDPCNVTLGGRPRGDVFPLFHGISQQPQTPHTARLFEEMCSAVLRWEGLDRHGCAHALLREMRSLAANLRLHLRHMRGDLVAVKRLLIFSVPIVDMFVVNDLLTMPSERGGLFVLSFLKKFISQFFSSHSQSVIPTAVDNGSDDDVIIARLAATVQFDREKVEVPSSLCTYHGIWHMVYGTWYMAHGTWYMAHGIWDMVYGTW